MVQLLKYKYYEDAYLLLTKECTWKTDKGPDNISEIALNSYFFSGYRSSEN